MSNFRYTRTDSFPPVIKNLIIINALVYLAQIIFDKNYQLTDYLALHPVDDPDFRPYQIITHMFTHALPPNVFHIVFNMFTLWMFGRILENVWGSKRFFIFYMICGLGAAGLHLLIQHLRYDPEILRQLVIADQQNDRATFNALLPKAGFLAAAMGASGAVMGVMAAFAYTFPNTELYIMLIPVPVKAKWAILGLVAIDLFGGVAQVTGDNLAHFAHLGGAITGFLLVLFWNKTNRRTLY